MMTLNMIAKQKLIVSFLFVSLLSCSQAQQKNNCADKIDQLYIRQKLHLIFCSYYFDKVNTFSGADTLYEGLAFYRDTLNAHLIAQKDSVVIANLKKGICRNKDTGLITEMQKWCEVSRKIAQIRSEVNFTIEGYMEFLNNFKKTQALISPYLLRNRTVYSLSTYEMEGIYFASIETVKSLGKEEQNKFFKKLRSWNFK